MASKNRTMAAKNAKVKKCKVQMSKQENIKDMCLWGSDGVNREPYHKRFCESSAIMKRNMDILEECILSELEETPDATKLAEYIREYTKIKHKLGL